MGKRLRTIFFAAVLVCPGWAGAEFKQSGNVYGANFILARTALGVFVAFSSEGAELNIRTFDPNAVPMSGVSSLFIAADDRGVFKSLVEPYGRARPLGGAAFLKLGGSDAILVSREAGSPFIAISGDSILITLGSTVLLNASWPELIAAVRSSEGSESYSFDKAGKISFGGKPAGLRIGINNSGVGDCNRAADNFLIVDSDSGETATRDKLPSAGLIAVTKNLLFDPETKTAYQVTAQGDGGDSSPCVVRRIQR